MSRRYVLELGAGVRRIYYETSRGVLAVTERRTHYRGRVLWSYVDSSIVPEVPRG